MEEESDKSGDELFGEAEVAGPKPGDQLDPRERLDRRVVTYWLTAGLAGSALFAGLLVLGLSTLGPKLPFGPALQWTFVGGAIAAQVVWTSIAAPLGYRVWRFSIGDQLLIARFGIIVRQEKVIPINRLQHVDLVRGPIERLFGLATLVVHTAGTEAVAFRLPGLAVERAQVLRDHILRTRGVDVV